MFPDTHAPQEQLARPVDAPLQPRGLPAVEFTGPLVDRGRQRTQGDLATQADLPRPFAHVLSQPMAYNGETFVKCLGCGLTIGNLHGALPESCPGEEDDAVLALAVEQWKNARLRRRLAFHADAERLRRAMASEIRG